MDFENFFETVGEKVSYFRVIQDSNQIMCLCFKNH